MNEIWKDIPWYEWLYQVSNMWIIKSTFDKKRCIKRDKIFRWYLRKWYRWCNLRRDNTCKTVFNHRLVAQLFIENPNNYAEVNHKNWIKTDNRVENLEWVSRSQNIQHSFKVLWRTTWGKRIKSISTLWEIKEYKSLREASKLLWIHYSSISKVIHKEREHTRWYTFELL